MNSRYLRNEQVVGEEGQKKLRNSSVLIIGCGALGSPAAMYLAGAGVGRIGLADFDTIDPTNLQRQLFYKESEAGLSKSLILATRITELNSEINVTVHNCLLTKKNGASIIKEYDFVIEATDNPDSKYLIDELCAELKIPVTIGGVSGMHGQVTTYSPGHYRFSDFFPVGPEEGGILPCAVDGVLGTTAGVVSSLQASEAIKYLSGKGSVLTDSVLQIDLSTNTFRVVKL